MGNGLRLLGSKLGYITSGKADNRDLSKIKEGLTFVSCLLSPIASPTSYCDIERFWSLEDIGVRDDSFKKDDEVALGKFNESVQLVNGRYEAGWPWKDGISEIPDNFKLAFSRLRSLLRRVEKQDEVVKTYDDTIKAQLQTGVIEQVEDGTSANRVHYIPHHCVIKPDRATTKLRIVYDASSKVNEDVPSLNDCLLRGPVFLSDICALLLRFRTFPVALVSDIEKAFLQVGLRQEDRDVTRFLWVKDYSKPLTRDNLITYRFARVPFGVISSPFLLSATIKHHLIKQRTEIAHHIASNIYVDNVICGRSNLEQSIQFYHEAKSLFQSISMNLREWYSNCPELLQTIPAYDRGKGTTTKVLGMAWDCEGDTFSCTTPKIDNFEVQTKRQLAQLAATVFDPCGLFSPVIVQAKMLIQRVWVLKLGWDDPLPADVVSDWQTCGLDLQCLPEIGIPRLVPSGSSSEPVELHCFCDASKGAYAAAIYVRSNSNFQFETNLIFAKSKLCPTKPISLPRLELMAVVVGVRMLKFVKAELGIPIKRCLVWTDSKCVLHWLRSVKLMTVFVSNRVKEINSHSGNEFRYVPTDKNPADLPSRGCSTSTLKSSCLWWHGPEFLQSSEADWPVTDLGPSPSEGEVAIPATGMALFNLSAPQGLYGVNPSKYSSLNKVLRVTAWVTRYLSALQRARIKRKQEILLEFVSKESLCLTAKEIAASELAWVFHVQQTSFYQESSSPLYNKVRDLKQKLDVFTDSSGLLRCGGRIHHADVSDETKFPILLPRDHALTRLIIQDCHERLFHAGVSHTLSEVRCRFWVPQGKSQVQSVIRKCQLCKLAKGGHFQISKPPPLPVFRVTQSAPFTFTGVDYLGPLLVKSPDRDCQKVWICLFVCAATRAIHLEVVQNLTTEQFLLALRRFAAMQRKPRMLISDNGKYFKLAHNVLQHIWGEIIHSQRVQDYSLQERIEWKFIPEYAPWMGGFYERLVSLVKTALKNVLRKASVTLVQLHTVVAEVSAVVNSRPLVLPDQAGELILTPNHLLGRVQFDGYPVDVSQGDAFVATSKHPDYVWCCGLRKGSKKIGNYQSHGFNLYGLMLTLLYSQWKRGRFITKYTLSGLLASNASIGDRFDHTVLLLSDSQCKQLLSIYNGNVVKKSGAKYHNLAHEIVRHQIDVRRYKYIIIVCGINLCRKRDHRKWKHSWKSLKRALDPIIFDGAENRVILNTPIWTKKARFVNDHTDWIKARINGIPNIAVCDWSSPIDNPFVVNGRLNRQLFMSDKFHVNHQGFRWLWVRWCQIYAELMTVSYELSVQQYAEPRTNGNHRRFNPSAKYATDRRLL